MTLGLCSKNSIEQRDADSTNPVFLDIGTQILERCSGVPLVIRTIASTLSIKETEREWRSFKDNELARISQKDGEILPTLKLSYDHLPAHLKHCFAYCRLYPKDYRIQVQTLVQLWIAQGFVKQSEPNQSLEEIGLDYFKDLAERSFFQEIIEYFDGRMGCKMHDLMHDLAELVAGRESGILDSNSNTGEVDEICRHITIDFQIYPSFKGRKLRTLLHFRNEKYEKMSEATWDFIISNCRCLRVLELEGLDLDIVPHSIHKLKHLRYLDLSRNDLKILPKSICKLLNLQVLELDLCLKLKELPEKIEKLVNLTHLSCIGCWSLTHMPRGIGKLTSLQRLSMFVVDERGSRSAAAAAAAADLSELGGLNNLRGLLWIKNLGFVKNAKEEFRAANLKEKQHLESLGLDRGYTYR
ncbi:putative disease resistance protein RGA4 [Hibiscus syriacus]|uniref:putative disease resistance protein RGA4 n=1 Tax=Hibiscus syriacus TaxID=106335 RepID=UPI0019235D58|nr:putative disease resistance protein RGA4 [Hibiscus syriacus]